VGVGWGWGDTYISMNRLFSGVGCVARFINQYIFVPMMGFRLSSKRVSSCVLCGVLCGVLFDVLCDVWLFDVISCFVECLDLCTKQCIHNNAKL